MRVTLKAMIALVGCLVLPGVVEAQGNAAEGENVFKKCKVCHDIGEGAKSKIGPILNDVVGRKAASIEGYPYSSDLKALGSQGFVWTEENLNKYLANVKDVVAHGKMVFPGLKDDQDRNDLIDLPEEIRQIGAATDGGDDRAGVSVSRSSVGRDSRPFRCATAEARRAQIDLARM